MKRLSILVMAGILILAVTGAAYSYQGRGWGRMNDYGPHCFEREYGRGDFYGRRPRHRAYGNDAPCDIDGSWGRGGRGFFAYDGEVKTADEAKEAVEKHLEYRRNPNLKVGPVSEKEDYFEVDIVTKDDSLVNRILVDKKTGRFAPAYR